jgi:integrase
LAKVNPFENADAPILRFLTQAEAIRLLNASPGDLRAFVRGALLTGARREELSKLTVADVNLANRTIFISGSKSGKSRHVPLSDEGVELFRAQTTGKTGDAFVFTKANGERWGKNHEVRPLRMANEVAHIESPVSFHELRHTYASLLAQAGDDLLTIIYLLGHGDTRITARHYAHLSDKTLANAVQSHLPSFGLSDKSNVHGLRERAAPALRPADLKAGQKLSAKGR